VYSVWEASCKRNVHASDPEFQVYKCPVFHGLTITCSNLPRQQKEEIRKLINDNGEDKWKSCSVCNIFGTEFIFPLWLIILIWVSMISSPYENVIVNRSYALPFLLTIWFVCAQSKIVTNQPTDRPTPWLVKKLPAS
jgi:hypothetical protein